ncbi:hypothetical protein AMTRI_Chr02g263800 [Amborella trichopoda]|uniref:Uncharacterized protein n=1 Tax=Amborella trichopoda TaxID=13333 RepID=U5D3D6_AMBTC|nr:uncharacterized protein LOC18445080 [Amborella trichopoda]ERN16755.1 hypothetical protein AMTR_s00057p00042010 [Amborella trichopoda]|eukprot:XP_006855288.1 uncharacterized protein LOC18445080 [Amborella trichopoda]
MGNCTSHYSPSRKTPPTIIDLGGNTSRVLEHTKIAEIMLENPGHLVSPVAGILRTRRISALKADEELASGEVYFIFPANRLNSRVSDEEMAFLDGKKREKSSRKVFPTSGEMAEKPVALPKFTVEEAGDCDTGFAGHRLAVYRNWMPVLETISEA